MNGKKVMATESMLVKTYMQTKYTVTSLLNKVFHTVQRNATEFWQKVKFAERNISAPIRRFYFEHVI